MSIVRRIRRRLRMARRQPAALRFQYLASPLHGRFPRRFSVRRLSVLTGCDSHLLAGYLRELAIDPSLVGHLRRADQDYRRLEPDFAAGTIREEEGIFLYALVRALRPRTVVETGTANGVSTSFLLAALAENQAGRLVSIDLPFFEEAGELRPFVAGSEIHLYDASPVPVGRSPGWMVPEHLRERWELRLGDARTLLPATLAELGEIDLFFHDSLHTREHMLFEFEAAWPHLADGGVLAADDVFLRKHDALPAFARSVGRPFSTFRSLGFVARPGSGR